MFVFVYSNNCAKLTGGNWLDSMECFVTRNDVMKHPLLEYFNLNKDDLSPMCSYIFSF